MPAVTLTQHFHRLNQDIPRKTAQKSGDVDRTLFRCKTLVYKATWDEQDIARLQLNIVQRIAGVDRGEPSKALHNTQSAKLQTIHKLDIVSTLRPKSRNCLLGQNVWDCYLPQGATTAITPDGMRKKLVKLRHSGAIGFRTLNPG